MLCGAHDAAPRGRTPGAWGGALLAVLLGACTTSSDGDGTGGGGGGAGSGGVSVNADLVALGASSGTTTVEAGVSIPVTFQVENAGPDPVGAFQVAAYLSADTTYDAGDVQLYVWSSPGLLTGGQFASSGSATIPVDTATGAWRVLVVADDDGRFSELDETNNVAAVPGTLNVQPPTHADLVALSTSFGPQAIQAGGTITVDHEVRNDGVEASGSFRVGVYLSSDPVITSSDLPLGQRSVAGLAVGSSDVASGTVTVPQTVPVGTWFVGVLADDLGTVVEMDETNNGLSATATLTVNAAPLPDLVPTLFTIGQVSVDAGQPFTVNDAVLNQGVNASPLFQVGIYLSDDADIDPDDDTLLGTRSITSLASGAQDAAGPWAVTVPGSTPGGTYFVGTYVDATDFVAEASESNNGLVATSAITVTVPPLPDLVATAFATPGPNSVDADGTGALAITYDVENNGIVASAATDVAVYISTDSVVTQTDIRLGTVALPALDVGAGAGGSATIPVPGGIASGSYRVGLWVDPDDTVTEIDEGNNLIVEAGLLDVVGGAAAEPNLVPELIDPSRNIAAPGESFQVVTRVANTGDLSTGSFRVVVVLSVDDDIEPTDTEIGSRIVPFGLGGGFSSVASGPVQIPASMADGLYRIGVYADADNVVVETDETDNGLADAGNFEVRTPPPPAPDLRMSALSIPAGQTGAGTVFDVDHEVQNFGDVDATSFRVGLYLSEDETIDQTDVLLATRVVTSLSVGGTSSATTAVQIPASTAAGTYWIGAIADDTDSVAESDETNNARKSQNTVDV